MKKVGSSKVLVVTESRTRWLYLYEDKNNKLFVHLDHARVYVELDCRLIYKAIEWVY